MTRHRLAPLALLALTPLFTRAAVEPKSFDQPVTRTIHYDYLAYTPETYDTDPTKKWPLILFLHGSGERGSDVDKLYAQGLPKLLKAGHQFPFLIIAPQCPEGTWWNTDDLDKFLDKILADYRVDEDRIYLTGLSMGGYGTWEWASRTRDHNRFAALVPICGGGSLLQCRNIKVPIWAFHGSKDPTVPMSESVRLVEAVRANGGDAKLTVYPDATHNSWTQAYDTPELYTWLLAHKRPPPTTRPTSRPAR